MPKRSSVAPRTIQVPIPSLGQTWTVRAMTWDEVARVRGTSDLDTCFRVIASAVIVPDLTVGDCHALMTMYGEGVLIPALDAVIDLSGFRDRMLAWARGTTA